MDTYFSYDNYRLHGEARAAEAVEHLDEAMKAAGYSPEEVAEATLTFKDIFNDLEADYLDATLVPLDAQGATMSEDERRERFQAEVEELTASFLVLEPLEP